MASGRDFYREGPVYFQNGENMDNREPDAPSTFWGKGKATQSRRREMGRIIPRICTDLSMNEGPEVQKSQKKRSRMQYEEHVDMNDDYEMVAEVTDPGCFRCRTRERDI